MNGLACFTLSFLAGLCTAVGGALAVRFHKQVQPLPFACALAFAAGVMILVSFVEVYKEAEEQIQIWLGPSGNSKPLCLTLFLAGWAIASCIDGSLHIVLPNSNSSSSTKSSLATLTPKLGEVQSQSSDASNALNRCMRLISSIYHTPFVSAMRGARSHISEAEKEAVYKSFTEDTSGLSRIGYFTALVLALHNIPEGIATFFSAGHGDGSFGINMALAVGIHNIPEGVAVAVPIYCGTRSAKTAMLYTVASGMAEPIGGLTAWLLLRDAESTLTPKVLGFTLMITSGIMVNVALKELFATALRYDVGNSISTVSFFGGMLTMATSLIILSTTVAH